MMMMMMVMIMMMIMMNVYDIDGDVCKWPKSGHVDLRLYNETRFRNYLKPLCCGIFLPWFVITSRFLPGVFNLCWRGVQSAFFVFAFKSVISNHCHAILQSWFSQNCPLDTRHGEHTVQQNIEPFVVECKFARFQQIFCV